MSMTPRQLIEALSDCGILGADDATELSRPYTPETTGGASSESSDSGASSTGELTQSLARQLIADGKATRFQVRAVLAGASKGLRIGDYIVLDRIGAGGMGSVYKARHRVMKRMVALKLLPRAATNNPRLVQRFYREVEAAAALTHPNIVTAYDAGEFQGVHYLVSEFVDGLDLSQLVKKRGPLPLAAAVDYTVQAGRGLTYAHEHGVIHRDVKPGNLLLSRDGVIKVLDMGLARFTEADQTISEESLTVTGRLMGTVEYMSPEHAANPKNADHRSDIYSLGCTFFRLLTGRLPYKGETAVELIIAQREEPTPKLSDYVPGVPDAVQRVFEKMLAKSPDDRYQTMAEAVDALAGAAGSAHLPPAAAPISADFDHESDSQIDTQLDPRGASSLLGELAAARSGLFEPPSNTGSASGTSHAPEPLPAWPEATTAPEPQGGVSIGALLLLLLLVVGAALAVVFVVANPSRTDPTERPPIVEAPKEPAEPVFIKPPDEPSEPTDPTDPTDTEPPVEPTDPTPTDPTETVELPSFVPLVVGEWRAIFDGEKLGRWEAINRIDAIDAEPGKVTVEGRQIMLKPGDPLTGVSWSGPMPTSEFELTLEAKVEDAELLSVAFPVGDQRAAVQLDAKQRKAGLFHVDSTGLRDDPMAAPFDGAVAGWHQLRIRVTYDRVQAYLNAQPIADQPRVGHTFGAPKGFAPMHPLTVFASRGGAALRNIRIRKLEPPTSPIEPPMPTDPTDPTDPTPPADPAAGVVKVIEPSTDWHALIPSVDTARDARGGRAIWTREDDSLIAKSDQPQDLPLSTLLIPAQITGPYQLKFTVKVDRGFGPLVVTLPIDGKRLHLVFDGPTGSGFLAGRNDAVRLRDRNAPQRIIPSGGPHKIVVRIDINDDRVKAAARVNELSVPGWSGAVADLPELTPRQQARDGGAAGRAITFRVAARELTITDLELQVLPGGHAELTPVAADDPAVEPIDLPRPTETTGPDTSDTDRPDRPRPPRPGDRLPPRRE